MSKLKSFVGLDFKTVKPYFTVKNLMICYFSCDELALIEPLCIIEQGLDV